MAAEIARMLVLSTAHVSKQTIDRLEAEDPAKPVTFPKGEYGFFVFTGPQEAGGAFEALDPECPADLAAVITFARTHDCIWVCLDRDGDTLPDLPTYDW